MNEKLNIQDLIDLLAEKHGMGKKDAEGFVKEFFLLIEEALEKDKYVKIKGLGTFKLIDVESRESVNVNTGERFEIQGHTKVSFTPEPALKEIINKPFSHFETVVLNENTVLEDTILETEGEGEEVVLQPLETTEDIAPLKTVGADKPETAATVKNSEKEAVVEGITTEGEKVEGIAVAEETERVEEIKKRTSSLKYFISIVVVIAVLCGGVVFFMYYPDILGMTAPEAAVENRPENAVEIQPDTMTVAAAAAETLVKDSSTENTDTVHRDTQPLVAPVRQETMKKAEISQSVSRKEKKRPAAPPVEPDSVGYTIIGTEATYTIKEGETLTRIALRFYGTKALWPYIVKHNPEVIKNPDNVPSGTTIKIPKLMKKQ